MRRTLTVAVIGAGAAGTLTARALLLASRQAQRPVRVLLIDPAPATGRGVAYGTTDEGHLLNVPAGRMGADPENPKGFLEWVRAETKPGAQPDDFLPRAWFGAYLQDELLRAMTDAARTRCGELQRLVARAVSVDSGPGRRPVTVRCEADSGVGVDVSCDVVIVATGNAAPGLRWAPSALRASPVFVADPWAPRALPSLSTRLARCPSTRPIVLVGSGLTTADLALTLAKTGRPLLAVSRSGRLPAVHRSTPTAPITPALPAAPLTADGLRAWVSRHIEETQATTGDWRAAIDGLRPLTSALWQRLPMHERAKFLSLDARRWEQVRHRMSPAIGAALGGLLESQQLQVRRGTVHSAVETADGIRVRLSADRADAVDAAAVINCTGPEADPYAWGNPVIDDLLARGVASSDPLGLGLRTDSAGRLVGPAGQRTRRIFTLGSTRRGSLYESTAIPEIRCQAAQLAQLLLLPTGNVPSTSTSRIGQMV
jgi:uncharacterized NAD(P)/FAD-binding protein YdhS